MRKPITAIALAIAAAALLLAQSVTAQERTPQTERAQTIRPIDRSAMAARTLQVVPVGCTSVTVEAVTADRVVLFDMQRRRVGVATRAELSSVTTALFCNSEPEHARIQTAQGLRLVLRSALRAPTAAPSLPRIEGPAPAAGPRPAPPPPAPVIIEKTAPPPQTQTQSQSRSIAKAPAARNGDQAPADAPPEGQIRTETRDRELTPVLVELLSDQARTPRQGGSAVALLADPLSQVGAGKNLILCQGLFVSFDQASRAETEIGVRRGAEGELELLRPIYWPTQALSEGQPGAAACPQRLQSYDYPRSYRIGRKLGLVGAGPYLVVERHDLFETERVAAVIDLSRTPPDEIASAVRYFRDGFLQIGDVWAPQQFQRRRVQENIISFLGEEAGAEPGFIVRLLRASRQVGCPLTNLVDVCSGQN